jgi:hypothetical protein
MEGDLYLLASVKGTGSGRAEEVFTAVFIVVGQADVLSHKRGFGNAHRQICRDLQ